MQEKGLYTVVVADDEDELREAVCKMLPWEKLGFRLVGEAGNGLDALELVEQLEPDLLLTDIRMPFISGIELARQVREIHPSMHIAFLSGYDDFEYAKEAIHYNIISYMLKPVTLSGLEKEMTVIRNKMDAQLDAFAAASQTRVDRANFLIPLLLDDYARAAQADDERQLRAFAQDNGILQGEDDWPHYVVMVTYFAGMDGANITRLDAVNSVDLVVKKYFRHTSFFACGKVITLLLGNASDFAEYLHICTGELTEMAARAMGSNCSVGVSRETDALARLHDAYREVADTLSYTRTAQSGVRFITDLRPLAPVHADEVTDEVESIEAAFKSGDRDGMLEGVERLTETGENGAGGRSGLDMAALQLVSDVCRMVYTAAGSEAMEELQSRGVMPDIGLHYESVQTLRTSLGQFCTQAMELVAQQQKKGGSLVCQRALDAIEQGYTDETLSLVSLSEKLNVSPNYLSACIKKYAGESFINILIRRRMDEARTLLLETPLKISEVAARCGYTDQHYFSYCFKKYCGTSPNLLRRQNQEEKG